MIDRSPSLWKLLRDRRRLFLISGPCVLESDEVCLRIGGHLRRVCSDLGLLYVFKASYDKANRSSGKSFRGPGLQEGRVHVRRH